MSTTNSGDSHTDLKPLGSLHNPIRTGDKLVDELYQREWVDHTIDFNGAIIPWAWIRKLRTRQNRIYWIAIMVLNDIVVHYRAKPQTEKGSGRYKLKKRFKWRFYHLNEAKLAEKLEVVPDVISRALKYLETKHKVIKRHYSRKIDGFAFKRHVFIELCLDALEKLCQPVEPEKSDDQKVGAGNDQKVGSVPTRKSVPTGQKVGTDPNQKVEDTEEDSEQEKTLLSEEQKTTATTKASPQAASAGDSVEDVTFGDQKQGAAPPAPLPKPESKNKNSGDGHVDPVETVLQSMEPDDQRRCRLAVRELKRRWEQFDQTKRKLIIPVQFVEALPKMRQELGWTMLDIVHTISFSWLAAKFLNKTNKAGYKMALYSVACMDGLTKFFKKDRDEIYYIQSIANKEIDYESGQSDPVEDMEWWEEMLEKYDIIRDKNEFHDQVGIH